MDEIRSAKCKAILNSLEATKKPMQAKIKESCKIRVMKQWKYCNLTNVFNGISLKKLG